MLIDCDHRTPAAVDEGYPYIAIPQLKDGHISLNGVRRISEADYVEWTRKLKPQADDVIVVRRCNSGQSAHVPAGLECAIGQNLVVLRADGKFVRPDFLRWLVSGPDWWEQVGKFINVGAVFDSLRCKDIPNFKLRVPPLEAQREISATLGAIDDRIALLRETNATLEAIAQALFKSWFADFDPVRAKQAGRAPEGMDEATAALFPDSFEDSELGEVPRGWQLGSVASLMRLHKGGVNPGDAPEEWFQHFSLPAFDDGQTPLMQQGVEIKSNKTSVPDGAVLLSKLNPHIPRVWLPSSISAQAVCSTEFLVFAPSPISTTNFVYSLLNAPGFCGQLCQLVTGTSNSHQRVKPESVLSLPQVVPSAECIRAYDAVVDALYARLKLNREAAQQLASLRDTLLPRLISGQLRLPEATEAVEEAQA
ncbi:MAG: restriction endonuclease subunit S [Inhella sp.]